MEFVAAQARPGRKKRVRAVYDEVRVAVALGRGFDVDLDGQNASHGVPLAFPTDGPREQHQRRVQLA